MTALERVDDLVPVRAAVTRRLGLLLDRDRPAEVDAILREQIAFTGVGSARAYAALLDEPAGAAELRVLAERLTVGETYFFRNPAQLTAFTEAMLPAVLPGALGRGRLRLLSAGCSSGEEAYSLAILARDRIPPDVLEVLGADLRPMALEQARRAVYSEWSLRLVPPDIRRTFFRREGAQLRLEAAARAHVSFLEHNLVDDGGPWATGPFDVVFFRNVAMYLTASAFARVVERCAAHLVSGGFLVLGDAETLRGLSTPFELRHTHGAFYYQLSSGPRTDRPTGAAARQEGPTTSAHDDLAWADEILRSAARIAHLSERTMLSGPPPAPTWDLAVVLEHLREERLDAAQEALDALPPAADDDLQVLLLRAVVLTNRGPVGEAERACRRLLDLEPRHAGGHYLLALCREQRGDPVGAAEDDRAAASLDPGFAMPRLHLARLARRAGDEERAREELRRAKELLRGEDEARLLLYGGGFSRETLLALCEQGLSEEQRR